MLLCCLIALHFTFRTLIHFQLIFVKSIRYVSRSLFPMWMSNCFSITYWKDFFSHLLALLLCQRLADFIYVGLFLSSAFCSTDPFVCSFISTTALITVLKLDTQSSNSDVLFQYCVEQSGSFASTYELLNHFANIHKITFWNFDWDCTESVDQVWKNRYLDNIESSCSCMEYLNIYLVLDLFWNFHQSFIVLLI